jgi:dihydroxyacetone kinase
LVEGMSQLSVEETRLTHRGLAGTILVYKLAAALSEQGADLDKVEAVAKYATTRLGTLGIGLDHCHVCPPSRISQITMQR